MGAITQALAASARSFGATIATNAVVDSILYEPNPDTGRAKVRGVKMTDGSELYADTGVCVARVAVSRTL